MQYAQSKAGIWSNIIHNQDMAVGLKLIYSLVRATSADAPILRGITRAKQKVASNELRGLRKAQNRIYAELPLRQSKIGVLLVMIFALKVLSPIT